MLTLLLLLLEDEERVAVDEGPDVDVHESVEDLGKLVAVSKNKICKYIVL